MLDGKMQELKQLFEDSFQGKIQGYLQEFEKKSSGYRLPEVDYLESYSTLSESFSPKFSISLPLKNRENDIADVLDTLVSSLNDPTELFILFDNCEDQSETVVRTWLSSMNRWQKDALVVHLLRSGRDLFESTCENIIFRLSSGSYLVSTQADIYMEDKSFLSRSTSVLEKYSDVFAVSGRGVVNEARVSWSAYKYIWHLLSRIQIKTLNSKNRKFRLGIYFPGLLVYGDRSARPRSKMVFTQKQMRTLFIGPTILRGPVVWRAETFFNLGGYRDECFFLGRDEMDLCQRAYDRHGSYVGFVPSTSYSFLWQGTSHQKRSPAAEAEMSNRAELAHRLCPDYFKPSKSFIYPRDYQRSF